MHKVGESSMTTSMQSTKYSNMQTSGSVKPIASARTVVIQRTAPGAMFGGGGGGGGGMSREVEIRRSFGMGMGSAPGSKSSVMHSGVSNIVTGREKEKGELRDLNERLANYIEKMRFLEAQNKKLANELGTLRDRWGKETERIKQMYEVEMGQLRKLLDESEKGKAELEIRIHSLEDQVTDLEHLLEDSNQQHTIDRETIEKLNQQMADYDSEISLLRRRVGSFDDDRNRDKKEVQRLRDELTRLRMDLDQETLSHITSENEAQSLRDEIEFMKQVHESEMKELAALAYRDTTSENREYWKSEMSQALHDIQTEYDSKMDTMRGEMESHYNLKIQEVRTNSTRGNMELTHSKEENTRIKSQLSELRDKIPNLEAKNAQLERLIEELRRESEERSRDFEVERNSLRKSLMETRSELEAVLIELQALLDAKLSLELEIAAYRKLLEGEESRTGLRTVIEQAMTRSDQQYESSARVAESSMSMTGGMSGGMSGGGSGGMSGGGSGGMSGGGSGMVVRNQMGNIIKGEMSAKTTYQRTAKGNISIQECSPDGKFLTLENTGKRREDIGGMRITRNVDNGRSIVRYTVPDGTNLDHDGRHKTIKIWARGHRPTGSNDLECLESSWGVGANIQTVLYNNDGEEKATHLQRTVYQANQ